MNDYHDVTMVTSRGRIMFRMDALWFPVGEEELIGIRHDTIRVDTIETDQRSLLGRLGFEFYKSAVTDDWDLRLPIWFLFFLTAPLPAVWTLIRARRQRRLKQDTCPICGYDLRATPNRCPECGTAIKSST